MGGEVNGASYLAKKIDKRTTEGGTKKRRGPGAEKELIHTGPTDIMKSSIPGTSNGRKPKSHTKKKKGGLARERSTRLPHPPGKGRIPVTAGKRQGEKRNKSHTQRGNRQGTGKKAGCDGGKQEKNQQLLWEKNLLGWKRRQPNIRQVANKTKRKSRNQAGMPCLWQNS